MCICLTWLIHEQLWPWEQKCTWWMLKYTALRLKKWSAFSPSFNVYFSLFLYVSLAHIPRMKKRSNGKQEPYKLMANVLKYLSCGIKKHGASVLLIQLPCYRTHIDRQRIDIVVLLRCFVKMNRASTLGVLQLLLLLLPWRWRWRQQACK